MNISIRTTLSASVALGALTLGATAQTLYLNEIYASHSGFDTKEFIELSNREQPLRIGEAIGGIDDDTIKRQLISRTIQEHLEALDRKGWLRAPGQAVPRR